MMVTIPIGVAAARLGVSPRLLTDWFYRGILDAKRCPIESGRRAIPVAYLPAIAARLKRAGYSVSATA